MDLRKKVLSGLGWSGGNRLISQLFTWTVTIVVMRLLSPGDYGLMAMAGFFINFLALLNELGLGAALIQKKDIDDLYRRQVFGLLLISNCAFYLILSVSSPNIANFFNEQRLIPILRVSSIQFLMMSFSIIPQSLLMRSMDFKKLSIIDLVSNIAGSVITLILALMGYGVWSLVWGSLSISLVRTVGLTVASRFICAPSFSMKGLRETISFGGYVMGSRVLWFFYTQADTFIIGKFLGKELLGYYSVSMQLASLPMEKTSGIINQVAFPAFASIQNESQKVSSYFLKAVRIGSFFAFPILWGMSSIAPELVAVFLGDKWHTAALPFQLLSLVIPIRMISNLMAPAMLGVGRADISFYNTLLGFVVMPTVIVIFAHWGLLGVCLAWMIFFPLVFWRNLSRVVAVIGIRVSDVVAAMIKPLLAAATMYVAVMALKALFGSDPKSITHLVLFFITGAMVYGAMIGSVYRQGCREVLGLIIR